jgi:hypothetical protein
LSFPSAAKNLLLFLFVIPNEAEGPASLPMLLALPQIRADGFKQHMQRDNLAYSE